MDIKNILLVDDDKAVNFLNQFILKDSKIEANMWVATNGREALDMIATQGCPDIIFLDINMPVMDGFEFLETFEHRSCYKKTKI